MNRDDPEFIGLVELARRLRGRQTPAEEVMWEVLRGRKFLGLKFRRQHRVGTFIIDFFCQEQRLVIELDGGVHSTAEQAAIDENRDAFFEEVSHTVLRFPNERVFEQMDRVLEEIAGHCKGVDRTRLR